MRQFATRPSAKLMVVISAVLLVTGCQTGPGQSAGDQSLQFAGAPRLKLPPRNIDDIKAALDKTASTPLNLDEDRKLVQQPVPPTTDRHQLATFYWTRGRAAVKLGLMSQAIEDLRKANQYAGGLDTRQVEDFRILQELAGAEQRGGNFLKSLEARERALSLLKTERNLGIQMSMRNANARIYVQLGETEKAKEELKKIESILITARTRRNWRWFQHNWSIHAPEVRALLLENEGRYAEAEPLRRFVLESWIRDIAINPERAKHVESNPPTMNLMFAASRSANALAENLVQQQRYSEAEAIVRSELYRKLNRRGRYWQGTVSSLNVLSNILFEQGRYSEARELAEAAVDTLKRIEIPETAIVAIEARRRKAISLSAENRHRDAVAEFARIEKILSHDAVATRVLGHGDPEWALSLLRTGSARESLAMLESLYQTQRSRYGEQHVVTAEVLGLRGMALAALGRHGDALRDYAAALPVLTNAASSADGTSRSPLRNRRYSLILEGYLDLLVQLRDRPEGQAIGTAVLPETFRIAGTLHARGVTQALTSSAARSAATDPALIELVNREQEAARQVRSAYERLATLYTAPPEERGPETVANLRRLIDQANSQRRQIYTEIERRFPRFANLLNPQPATVDSVQSRLADGEVMVAVYASEKHTYVWALPKQGEMQFSVAPFGRDELARRVAHLRQSLDPSAATIGAIPAFDVVAAHALYRDLFGGVASAWQGQRHLIVVPHASLGQLPVALLPVQPVTLAADREARFDAYRQVPWLVRQLAVSQLPSASALIALRDLPPAEPNRRTFIGFGDPIFNRQQLQESEAAAVPSGAVATRRLARRNLKIARVPASNEGESQTTTANSSTLAEVPRLPDTAAEIREIATVLGADGQRDVFLRLQATEDNVRKTDLLNRRIIMFATHGLVPGELDGLQQPALALTAPELTGSSGDGLLTMSEVLGLRLNADWVVLSACNTAAGEDHGGEAISGLGRAFFYAGTRSLLVTHWPVETVSARLLTTDLFRRQAAQPQLNRAEALRQTMLGMIDNLGETDPASRRPLYAYAHPIFWAPYALVGDSGR